MLGYVAATAFLCIGGGVWLMVAASGDRRAILARLQSNHPMHWQRLDRPAPVFLRRGSTPRLDRFIHGREYLELDAEDPELVRRCENLRRADLGALLLLFVGFGFFVLALWLARAGG